MTTAVRAPSGRNSHPWQFYGATGAKGGTPLLKRLLKFIFIILIVSGRTLCQIADNGGVALADNAQFEAKWVLVH